MPNCRRRLTPRLWLIFLGLALSGCASAWRAPAIVVATIDRGIPAAAAEWGTVNVAKEKELLTREIGANHPANQVQAEIAAWRSLADRITLALSALLDSTQGAKDAIKAAAAGRGAIGAALVAVVPAFRALVDALRAAGVALPTSLADLTTLLGGM